jgi:hypothetical protein
MEFQRAIRRARKVISSNLRGIGEVASQTHPDFFSRKLIILSVSPRQNRNPVTARDSNIFFIGENSIHSNLLMSATARRRLIILITPE